MSYAGDIGKKEGVKVYISKDANLKVRPTLTIVYYAWNARTMSNPGLRYEIVENYGLLFANGRKG